ncbi:MAG TPA: OmpA family protein [Ginsengibacter sp.]|nr:OmpA family protein [Ginsengibacter sp.]HRP44008.1 OmpA family protein [Ginsengibacter sp.]
MNNSKSILFTAFLLAGSHLTFAQVNNDPNDANFAAYSNFDFVAGKKVFFYDDFSNTLAKWKVIEHDASDEVESPGIKKINNDESHWFKTPRKGLFFPVDIKKLPETFTIEFDMWADIDKMSEMEGGLNLIFVNTKENREEFSIHFDENPQIQLDIHPSEELLYCIASKENGSDERVLARKEIKNGWNIGQRHRISISRNKTHIKLYINEKKFIDLPNGLPQKGTYTFILSTNMWGDGLYFTNFKMAEGLDHTNQLDNEGKFVTNAIYFNTNSAQIKPESWAALSQAATVIKSTQGKITIIGHTDSDGSEESNLLLSKKRAEAVKQALIRNFDIDAGKLLTDGKGEGVPVDSNNTSEGKANNRRVEFVLTK